MNDLTLSDANYVIVLLVINKCTNRYEDKPFEYKTLAIPNVIHKRFKGC